MTLATDLASATKPAYPKSPTGWEPSVEMLGDQSGKVCIDMPGPGASAEHLLFRAGFDPSEWRIDGPVNFRKWQRYDGDWLHYYKFNVLAGESTKVRDVHVEELTKLIRKRRRAPKFTTGDDGFLFLISDLQLGKREGDVGTPQIVDRYLETVDMAVARVKELRRIGRPLGECAVVGLGDIVEGCRGNYSNQEFLVDCNDRTQNRLARELITYTIDELRVLFERFRVACVGGNHGENRKGLHAPLTDDADNRDVSCFEAVKEAFDRAGESGIEWTIPEGELSIVEQIGGVQVGFAHGHKFTKGATPQRKALEWWKGQDFGHGAVRDAQILVTGHFHHYLATQVGHRTHFQTPAMDPGSKWFSDSTGEQGLPGVLTLRLDGTLAMGYDDVKVLVPTCA